MRYIIELEKDKDIFDLSNELKSIGSVHISLYENIRNVLQDTILELTEVQSWLKNYDFDGYYPDLSNRITKLKNLQEELKEIKR